MSRKRYLAGLIAAGMFLPAAIGQQLAGFHPVLELEKSVYVVDEAIRFWVGVSSDIEIPEALRSSCILHVRRPDGSAFEERLSWPIDGDTSRGWKGGTGLGKQVTVGRYTVSFECAGERTEDQLLEVVPNPFSTSIEARWVYGARSAVLHVENRTGKTLRFVKPGVSDSEVWIWVKEWQPPATSAAFIPQSELLRADEIPRSLPDKPEWSNLSRWPVITVPAGKSWDRTVSLQSGYSFRDGREYEVTLGTVLLVFVGEGDDPEARLFPLRMPVTAITRLHW
jgi:hypothetical protein